MAKVSMKEQLIHLKGITERLNTVHEAQIVQLRNYPRVIPNISKAETRLNIDNHSIVYECTSESPTFRKTKNVKVAIENVVTWIRTVVWDDTTVEFIVNGKSVYDTRIDRQEPSASS